MKLELTNILDYLIERYENMREGRERWLLELAADCIAEIDHDGESDMDIRALYRIVDNFIQLHESFNPPPPKRTNQN